MHAGIKVKGATGDFPRIMHASRPLTFGGITVDFSMPNELFR